MTFNAYEPCNIKHYKTRSYERYVSIVTKCYHRLDGPAYISDEGFQAWWQYGKRHRLDGPAIIDEDGLKQWWFKGIKINVTSQSEFERMIKLICFL